MRGSWRPNRSATYWPPLLWPSALCLSRSPDAQPGAWGPSLSGTCSHSRIFSPTGLISKLKRGSQRPLLSGGSFLYHNLSPTSPISYSSELQLTDFLSTASYIIVQSPSQSPAQSLEWHVWSSSSGNNCHAVHMSLSCGASVYECIIGFYLVPFRQPNPPTRFLLITAIGMCHFL